MGGEQMATIWCCEAGSLYAGRTSMFKKLTKRKTASVDVNRALRSVQASATISKPKRSNTRRLSRLNSWAQCIISAPGGVNVAGIVVDHSTSGARVRFRGHEVFPDQVTLIVPTLGLKRQVEVVWRDRGDAGLRYL